MDKYYVDYAFGMHDFIRVGDFDSLSESVDFANQRFKSNENGYYVVMHNDQRVFEVGHNKDKCDFSNRRQRSNALAFDCDDSAEHHISHDVTRANIQ